jgi:hypothetical protein
MGAQVTVSPLAPHHTGEDRGAAAMSMRSSGIAHLPLSRIWTPALAGVAVGTIR